MEKIIYENESSKLVANASGDVVTLTQTIEGEVIGTVSLYYEEAGELSEFIRTLNKED
jgi:hypothetical protein